MINAGESMEKIELFYTVSENVNATTVEKSGSDCKESACNAGDPGLILELGRSTGEDWQTTVHGVTNSQT